MVINCMTFPVSVNGLFHLTDTSDNGLIIKDGGKSLSIENNGYVSIMSFASVGKGEMLPHYGRNGYP